MTHSLALPEPRVEVRIREATTDDLPFIDALQRPTTKAVGYFPRGQFEGYISQRAVLIAEGSGGPLGYVISKDRYLKRDELGVVYQLNVAPEARRHLVGAALLRAAFERSAYGCRLYCCWCAQDLPANKFWEAMGFAPLAFRAGSDRKGRVHIFWQKRITDGDETTPYWYPFQTNGGAMRADRLAFPIPPGTHWSEVEAAAVPMVDAEGNAVNALPPAKKVRRKTEPKQPAAPTTETVTVCVGGKMRTIKRPVNATPFAAPTPAPAPPPPGPETALVGVAKAEAKEVVKVDPRFVSLNRELRDRYLERLNAEPDAPPMLGKYDATRALPDAPAAFGDAVPLRVEARQVKALAEAA